MKNKLIWLVAAVAALALALGLAACSGGSSKSAPADDAAVEAEQAADAAQEVTAVEGDTLVSSDVQLAPEELASPSVTVAYGDFDVMTQLSSQIQNGEMVDEVVEVDGLISHFADGMSYSIVEPSEDGSETIGTTLVIVGLDESEYPTDGTRVKVTGKVMPSAESGMAFEIYTLPEFVEVVQ
ncbi:MAG: hypothetical protein ACOYIP_00080 [Coriobacteriales bacterium]|jgi:hypothetical protein